MCAHQINALATYRMFVCVCVPHPCYSVSQHHLEALMIVTGKLPPHIATNRKLLLQIEALFLVHRRLTLKETVQRTQCELALQSLYRKSFSPNWH